MKATLREWTSRLLGAFGRGRSNGDIEQELQVHLALAEEDLRRQGMPPEAAAREARLQHGRSTQSIEILRERRGIPPLSTFVLDLKLGVRMLRKHWAVTLLGGLAMAATMTLGAAVFNLISAMLGTSVPLDEGDRIVIVQPFDPATQQQENTSAPVFERWRKMRSLTDVGAFRTVERELKAATRFAPRVNIAEMSAAGFTLARVSPLMGRYLLPEDERSGAPPVLVIGYDAWQSTFAADPGIIGQQVQLGEVSHTVIGVMPEKFRFPMKHQYWTSLQPQPSDMVTVFARLGPGATFESAQGEVVSVGFGESAPLSNSGQPLRPFVRPYVIGLTGGTSFGVAALIPFILPLLLLPPCVNIGALIFARTVARQGEFAARTALGASRARIVTQIFLEVLVLAAAAAAVAIYFAPKVAAVLGNMVGQFDQPFWMDFGVSYRSILFTAGLALVAAFVTGAIPALKATGRWQLSGLTALNRSTAPRLGKGWTAIVVAQVALSVAVLPTAVELAWSMLRPAILGPGFPVKEYMTARLDFPGGADPVASAVQLNAMTAEVARRLRAQPGVLAVTVSQYKPFGEQGVLVELDSKEPQEASVNRVDSAFFSAFGIRLLAGRGFEAIDNDEQRGTILVNRSFVDRVFPGENPVGRRVRVRPRGGQPTLYEIVGLVDNQFAYSDQATIYRPLTPSTALLALNLAARMGPAPAPSFAMQLRDLTSAIDPKLTVDDVEPLNDVYFFLSLVEYIFGSVPALATLGVLLFATVGIYTQMSFEIVQRRREIGIRAALGASPRNLIAGIFRSVFTPVLIGVAVGAVVALALNFYLTPLLFSTGRPLPWILPAAEAFVILMGVLALFGPVRRTLKVDATEALREG